MRLTGNESIEIRNFGPIQNVAIYDLRKINILIGESGSGKSTIMKVLAMMRWIYKMACIRSYLKISGISNSPFRFRLEAILRKNGLKPFLNNDTVIIYNVNDFDIHIIKGKIIFPKKIVASKDLSIQKIAYISDKRVMIPDLYAGNVVLRHNMFYLDETFLNFQKAIDNISLSEMKYLGIKMAVKKSNGLKKIVISGANNNTSFDNLPIINASSGIQSTVALHFIMQYFASHYDIVDSLNSTILKYLAETDNLSKFKATTDIGNFPNKKIYIHLEEPELSLFPTNQWGLMKYLVGCCLNSENTDMGLTMATHSPYILTALNIMIRAYMSNEHCEGTEQRFLSEIPPLSPAFVGAWEIVNGTAVDIIDHELQMIDGTYLDSASDIYEDIISYYNSIIYG